MTITVIPVAATTDAFTQQVEIGETVYDLTFLWNSRDHHWMMTIGSEGNVLVTGIKLVISSDLLEYARRIDGLPSGKLIIADLDNLDRDPDDQLFGDRVVLMYDDA